MHTKRRMLALCATVALALSFYALAQIWTYQRPSTPPRISSDLAATIGGPFELVDDTGAAVSQNDLIGRPSALFFGFTMCPEVCPTTLLELSSLLESLGSDADGLNVVFVSVDPERDTPEVLQRYLSSFDPRIRGFTGTEAQIAAMAAAYKAFYQRVPAGDSYTFDHTASIYLMDASNTFVGTISYREDHATALMKLRRLLAQGRARSEKSS